MAPFLNNFRGTKDREISSSSSSDSGSGSGSSSSSSSLKASAPKGNSSLSSSTQENQNNNIPARLSHATEANFRTPMSRDTSTEGQRSPSFYYSHLPETFEAGNTMIPYPLNPSRSRPLSMGYKSEEESSENEEIDAVSMHSVDLDLDLDNSFDDEAQPESELHGEDAFERVDSGDLPAASTTPRPQTGGIDELMFDDGDAYAIADDTSSEGGIATPVTNPAPLLKFPLTIHAINDPEPDQAPEVPEAPVAPEAPLTIRNRLMNTYQRVADATTPGRVAAAGVAVVGGLVAAELWDRGRDFAGLNLNFVRQGLGFLVDAYEAMPPLEVQRALARGGNRYAPR